MAKINNTDDLREVALEEIRQLKAKESTPAIANAVFNGIGKVIAVTKMEIDYARYIKKFEGAMPLHIGKGK